MSVNEHDSGDVDEDLAPSVAAAFLVRFDVKVGYAIAWSRRIPGLKLEDSVEFKSLPSGLHNVAEDIIYFVHNDEYIGVSAFLSRPAETADRNVAMLAVGTLVSNHGRLGNIWKHVKILKALVESVLSPHDRWKLLIHRRQIASCPENTGPLDIFWDRYFQLSQGLYDQDQPEASSPIRHNPHYKEISSPVRLPAEALDEEHHDATKSKSDDLLLPPEHPASSFSAMLHLFGPLIFPLHRIALLRKRIMFMTKAPLEPACRYVYLVSLLSSLPSTATGFLPLYPLPLFLRPLYNVGVSDLEMLTRASCEDIDQHKDYGWVACTADEIIAQKKSAYDYMVKLPAAQSTPAGRKSWPKIVSAEGREIQATQRDLRRYEALRRYDHGLSDQSPLPKDFSSDIDTDICENPPWTTVILDGMMWWAMSGSQDTEEDGENDCDLPLLRPGPNYSARSLPSLLEGPDVRSLNNGDLSADFMRPKHDIVSYFHRYSLRIFETTADLIDESVETDGSCSSEQSNPSEAPETHGSSSPALSTGSDRNHILIQVEDIQRAGLDRWSIADGQFLIDLIDLYWGRKPELRRIKLQCCGIRIY